MEGDSFEKDFNGFAVEDITIGDILLIAKECNSKCKRVVRYKQT